MRSTRVIRNQSESSETCEAFKKKCGHPAPADSLAPSDSDDLIPLRYETRDLHVYEYIEYIWKSIIRIFYGESNTRDF